MYAAPNCKLTANGLNLELKGNFITLPLSLALIYYSSNTSEIPQSQFAKVIQFHAVLDQAYYVVSSAYR